MISKMNSMKFGFTLVELAIVLVVIGLLLGMAFKGKTLIESARSKSDYQKINKISTAVNTYYSKYGVLPGLKKEQGKPGIISPSLFYNQLVNENLLKPTDFHVTSAGTAYINIIGCEEGQDPKHFGKAWKLMNPSENNFLCVYNTNIPPKDMKDDENLTYAMQSPLPRYLACQMETLIDDKDIYGGDGRVIEGAQKTLKLDNFDCSRYLNDPEVTNDDGPYAFRIF